MSKLNSYSTNGRNSSHQKTRCTERYRDTSKKGIKKNSKYTDLEEPTTNQIQIDAKLYAHSQKLYDARTVHSASQYKATSHAQVFHLSIHFKTCRCHILTSPFTGHLSLVMGNIKKFLNALP
jgi:hypothetical protein